MSEGFARAGRAAHGRTGGPERVLLLLPTGSDAELAADVLAGAGIESRACDGFATLAAELDRGAAAAVVAEEALNRMSPLFAVLDQAQPWSALPCLVLLAPRGPTARSLFALRALERHPGVLPSFLERPFHRAALLRAVRAALRAREAQYRARAAIDRLEADVKRRDDFLAMLGHELRNPISSIAYVAEMFERSGAQLTPDTRAWGAGLIGRQVRHLTGLLDELVDIARIRSGRIALKLELLDLRSIVEQSVETFRGQIATRRFELALPSAPVPVRGDRVRLTQVINNLLDNAFKYTERNGSIRLELETAGSEALLAVADDGRGISPDALQRIFEPFYQERSGRTGPKGFGLGLAMVEQIVRLHDGAVRARSAGARKGSRFELRLPLAGPSS